MSRGPQKASTGLGGPPRVDLLPQEFRDRQSGARQRTAMTMGVIVMVGAVAAAVFTSFVAADEAARRLQAEQDRTVAIIAEQAEYSEVRAIVATVDYLELAQQAAGLTEIEWTPLLREIESTLPGEVRIVEFSISSSTPFSPVMQSTDPLIGQRVASIVFTAESPDLPNVREWLDALTEVRGFTDATPGAVILNESSGRYEATITMGVDEQAWSLRFAAAEPEVGADAGDDGSSESGTPDAGDVSP